MRQALLAASLAMACGGSSAGDEGGGTSGTSTGGPTSGGTVVTTTQPPDGCESTEECMDEGGFCVAPYDAGGAGKGPAACVPECVGENDLQRWCVDDDACCEGLLCREVDGFCEPPDVPGTDTGTSSSTSTSG